MCPSVMDEEGHLQPQFKTSQGNLIRPRNTYRSNTCDERVESEASELSCDEELTEDSSPRSKSPKLRKINVQAKNLEKDIDSISKNDINHIKIKNGLWSIVILIIVLCFGLIGTHMGVPALHNLSLISPDDINTLKTQYPHQSDDVWYSIESGITDVNRFETPMVLMFMYNKETKKITDSFISHVAAFATFNFTQSNNLEPITLDNNELNSKEMLEDYGILIHKYKPELERKHVMIVKDLQNIPGIVAKAFHSYCDEFSPLVKKSLFFFTIDVTGFQGTDSKIVENVLREKWIDLKDDIFFPLFTRITSMILKLNPEGENIYLKGT